MTHKLTEEQQRAAHKIIVANRGDCAKKDDCGKVVLRCLSCPNSIYSSENFCFSLKYAGGVHSQEFQAENLRRSQAYLASHATPQEPAKRRPTPEEMSVGAPVRVRLWDEMVRDGKLYTNEIINFPKNKISFVSEMKKYCGTTHKVIEHGILDGCGDWTFIPEMLDYVEPEKVVEPKATEPVNFFDWSGKKVVFKDGRNRGANYTVCEVYKDLDFDGAIHFKSVFFFKLLELKGQSFPAQLFNLCETKDAAVEPEPLVKAPTVEKKSESIAKGKVDKLPSELRLFNFGNSVDGLRIVDLESQVADLTKKLAESTKRCDRLQRRLRAKWVRENFKLCDLNTK